MSSEGNNSNSSFASAKSSPKSEKTPKDMDSSTEHQNLPQSPTSDAPEVASHKWVLLLTNHRYNLARNNRFKKSCLADLVNIRFKTTKSEGLKYKNHKPELIISSTASPNITGDPNHDIHELLKDYNRCDGVAASMVINDRVFQEQRRMGNSIDVMQDSLDLILRYCIQTAEQTKNDNHVTTDTVKDIVGHQVEVADASKYQVVLYNLNEAPQQDTFTDFLKKDRTLIIQRLSEECGGMYNREVLEKAVKEVRRLVPRSKDREKSELRSHLWARPVLVTFETTEWRVDYLKAIAETESRNVCPGKTIQQRDTIKRLRKECKTLNDERQTKEELALQWVVSKCGKRKFLILDQTSEKYREHLLTNDAFETYNHKDKVNVVMGLQPTYQAMKRKDILKFKTSNPQFMSKEAKSPTGPLANGCTFNDVGDTVIKKISNWTEKEVDMAKREMERMRDEARNSGPAAAGAADLQ